LRELLLNYGGGFVVELVGAVFVGSEADDHDRGVGGIDFAIGGIGREVCGEIGAGGDDGGFDVASGAIDVAGEIELDGYGGCSEAAGGSHFGDAGDVAELAFERSGDGGSHDLGASTRQTGADRNGGKVHLRERRDGEYLEGDGAGDSDGHGEQSGGDRPMDEGRGDVHERPAGCGSVPECGALEPREKR